MGAPPAFVAIVFTDVVGSTELAARLGRERSDELRRRHFAILRDAIRRQAGTEIKNLGDGLMVSFATASDAVACAVAMQQGAERAARGGPEAVQIRVGIAAGEVTFEDADCFGIPVIEAARLCALAGPGRILVTGLARTVAGGRGGHGFTGLGPTVLKGLPDPVDVHEVGWEPLPDTGPPLPPRLAAEAVRTDQDAFVGRGPERAVLEDAWKRAVTGERQVVFLAGEPGIGKTRLATEAALAAHGHGALVLLGTCAEDLAVPYEPFVEALRHLVAALPPEELAGTVGPSAGALARLVPALADQFRGATGAADDRDVERVGLFTAVADVLAAAARSRPVVLVLDDLHWATKPTVLLLRHLLGTAGPAALLVIGTYRDSDVGRGHPLVELLADLRRAQSGVARLAVRGLSDAESLELVESVAGHTLDGIPLEVARALHAEADGSPFFMRELLRHLVETGELVREAGRWKYRGDPATLGIPDSVREVVGRRLSRLPADTERLLAYGAVAGAEFGVDILAAIAGLTRRQVAETLDPAVQAALVREVPGRPGGFAFAHALVRHTLYTDLTAASRQELHREVAQALESAYVPGGAGGAGGAGGPLANLAHHWAAATPAVAVVAADVDKAAAYAEAAGTRAMESLAYEEAVHHFELALRAATGERRCRLLFAIGGAAQLAGDIPAAVAAAVQAAEAARALGRGDLLGEAALVLEAVPDPTVNGVLSRLCEEALAAPAGAVGGDGVRARLLALRSHLAFYAGDEESLDALSAAALAAAHAVRDDRALAAALRARQEACPGPAGRAERLRLAAEMLAVSGRTGAARAAMWGRLWRIDALLEGGRLDAAEAELDALRDAAGRIGGPASAWHCDRVEACLAQARGRYAHAAAVARRGFERMRAAEPIPAGGVYAAVTGALAAHVGVGPDAEALLRVPIDPPPRFRTVARLGRAFLQLTAGRRDEALASYRDAGPVEQWRLPASFVLPAHVYGVHLAVGLGLSDDLPALLGRLAPHRGEHAVGNGVAYFGPIELSLGRGALVLGRLEEAVADLTAAADSAARAGARGFVAEAGYHLATALLARNAEGDVASAVRQASAADGIVRELGMAAYAERTRALVASLA